MTAENNNTDVTSEATTQLRRQLAWYKAFFDHASDAAFMIQPDTWSVLDANEYASVLTGMNRDELMGTALPQFRRVYEGLQRSAAAVILVEIGLDAVGFGKRMVEVSARLFEYNGQQIILSLARDISEQRELSEKIIHADKMALLGRLSAGVAHEIRNPLAAINLNLQVLQRKLSPESPEMFNVNIALQGVERLGQIVDATLNFSRPSISMMQQEDVNSLLKTTLKFVENHFARKTISVLLEFGENLPPITMDGKQMQQVFINLLTNSSDAIAAKGEVKISTYLEKPSRKKNEKYVVVKITDSGVGIPQDDLQQIFNPFFTRKADGTGLGLPITQKIVHQHGGTIDVESAVGAGTHFYVKLPVTSRL